MLTDRFDEAFQYAHRLHRTQTRKGTTIPYISHLMVVAALVIEHGGTEDQAIAALLHDAVEDQGGVERLSEIRKKFGDNIATIVSDCTDAWTEPKPEWRPRKEAYLAVLPGKPRESLLVSLADKTHNAEAILFDYRALADRVWERFNGGAEGTRWYYSALAEVFSKAMPGGSAFAERQRFFALSPRGHPLFLSLFKKLPVPPSLHLRSRRRMSFPQNVEVFSRRFSLKSRDRRPKTSKSGRFRPDQAFEFIMVHLFPKFRANLAHVSRSRGRYFGSSEFSSSPRPWILKPLIFCPLVAEFFDGAPAGPSAARAGASMVSRW